MDCQYIILHFLSNALENVKLEFTKDFIYIIFKKKLILLLFGKHACIIM